MLKEIKMTSNTKQMIALMEALNAVNGPDNASQSLNESTQVDEMRRGADGKLRGQLFSNDEELQQKADRFQDAVYALLGSGPNVRKSFKKAGIDLDKITSQLQNIPVADLETSYTGAAAEEHARDMAALRAARYGDAAEEQNEAFGMPGKPSDRQADTMYALAMDYKDKFGFETFPVGEHMKDWLASVADEMKSEGITPAQLRVYLTAAYTFAKGGYQPKSESAELSEDTIEKILKKMVDDGKLTVDKKGNYTSELDPVLDPETKKAMPTSIAKNAKPGPRRDRAVANMSEEDREMNEFFGLSGKKPTTPEETKAYIFKKYAGEIKKVRDLYKQYQGAEGPNMSRDGKSSRFKDATKSTEQWTAYTTAGKKLQQKIWQQIRQKDLPGAGDLVASFIDFQKILQK